MHSKYFDRWVNPLVYLLPLKNTLPHWWHVQLKKIFINKTLFHLDLLGGKRENEELFYGLAQKTVFLL